MAANWAVLAFLGVLLAATLGDLVSEEIRGWLDLIPRGFLRLAAARLDQAQRETIYQDEWLPELHFALRGAESRPITRLILGTRYALGLLVAARRISRRIDRDCQAFPATQGPHFVSRTLLFELAGVAVHFTNTTGDSIFISPQGGAEILIANGDSYSGPLTSEGQ